MPIERRPSGMHVVSARIPADLAMAVNAHADRTGRCLSDILRDALESHLRPVFSFEATYGGRLRLPGVPGPATSNSNTVVAETLQVWVA